MTFLKEICFLGLSVLLLQACQTENRSTPENGEKDAPQKIVIEAESFVQSSPAIAKSEDGKSVMMQGEEGWILVDTEIPVTGRYISRVKARGQEPAVLWLEAYPGNEDERTYNITADMPLQGNSDWETLQKEGSPLAEGKHSLKLHLRGPATEVDWVSFELFRPHQLTPDTVVAKTEGAEWSLLWSDEFEGSGLPDSSKWAYDVGNWGWGNNEPQYYTERRTENARLEDGNLIIEARKDDMGNPWTSARLTTRGKVTFLYGKIEFRAKVPVGDGSWAAGWTLGDAYRDELSWPYCGEIDILETTGHEIDDETGDGLNHASCHTRAYYFKQNNHITSTIEVSDMDDTYHTYAIEWLPTGVKAYLDGEHYYTYDKLNGDWEWPFSQPQNLIINLAMGGGMGGQIDPALTSQKLIVDYVRVYELK